MKWLKFEEKHRHPRLRGGPLLFQWVQFQAGSSKLHSTCPEEHFGVNFLWNVIMFTRNWQIIKFRWNKFLQMNIYYFTFMIMHQQLHLQEQWLNKRTPATTTATPETIVASSVFLSINHNNLISDQPTPLISVELLAKYCSQQA